MLRRHLCCWFHACDRGQALGFYHENRLHLLRWEYQIFVKGFAFLISSWFARRVPSGCFDPLGIPLVSLGNERALD